MHRKIKNLNKKRALVLALALVLAIASTTITCAVLIIAPQYTHIVLITNGVISYITTAILNKEQAFIAYRYKLFKLDKRGAFDPSRLLDMIITLMFIPIVLNLMSSFLGGSSFFGSDFINLIMQIFPLLMVLDLLGDAVGGKLKDVFNIMIMFAILPTLLSSFGALPIDPTLLNSMLGILFIMKLIESFK